MKCSLKSNQFHLHRNYKEDKQKNFLSEVNGVPGGIRTPDLLVRSQTLYPAELQAQGL